MGLGMLKILGRRGWWKIGCCMCVFVVIVCDSENRVFFDLVNFIFLKGVIIEKKEKN